jgi:hypothetical protein
MLSGGVAVTMIEDLIVPSANDVGGLDLAVDVCDWETHVGN